MASKGLMKFFWPWACVVEVPAYFNLLKLSPEGTLRMRGEYLYLHIYKHQSFWIQRLVRIDMRLEKFLLWDFAGCYLNMFGGFDGLARWPCGASSRRANRLFRLNTEFSTRARRISASVPIPMTLESYLGSDS